MIWLIYQKRSWFEKALGVNCKLFNRIIKYSTFNMLLEEWSWLIIYFNDLFINKKDLFASVVVVQLLTHVRLFVTPWTATHQASLSFTVSLSLLKLMSIVSDAIQPSHPLLSPSLAFILSQHQGLFRWVGSLAWGGQSIYLRHSINSVCKFQSPVCPALCFLFVVKCFILHLSLLVLSA